MKRIRVHALILRSLFAVCLLAMAFVAEAQTQDVITVETVTTSNTTVDVPVYVRDVSGTPLGIDQPAGSRIQSLSIRLNYAPTAQVTAVTFTRAGITANLTPAFQATPSSPGSISYIATFAEGTNLIPFVSNAPAPGNQVGRLTFTLAPSITTGTTIALTLDATLTQLANEGGTTSETTVNGRLALVNGAIHFVAAPVPSLSDLAMLLLVVGIAVIALKMRM